MKKVSFYGKSDLGKIRTNNEDAFLLCNIWDNDHVLAVAIDGVGGYEGGEVAAALAQESIIEFLNMNTPGDCLLLIKEAVIAANNRIFSEREQTPSLANMSCVLTAALIEVDSMRVNIAHVGDTRIYQYASSRIEKLSHDHSLVGYREEIGDLTEEEAMTHPQRNIISRDVGSKRLAMTDSEYVEVASYPLENRTQLLLCSDGLCDMVTSKQMAQILSMEISVEKKVDDLIQEALNAGGRDNVTVVLVQIESDEEAEEDLVPEVEITEVRSPVRVNVESKKSGSGSRKWMPALFMLVFIAGFGAGILSYPMIFKSEEKEKIISVAPAAIADSTDTISGNNPIVELPVIDVETDSLSVLSEDPENQVQENIEDENS